MSFFAFGIGIGTQSSTGEWLEVYYNKPIDIEWAYEKDKLYLLQARPITTDLSEVTWAFENVIKGKIYARGSIIELLPEPPSHLTAGQESFAG